MTLRAWREDPTTPIDSLPALTDESLPRAVFDRLFEHVHTALDQATQTWERSYSKAMRESRDLHDLADRLVKLRVSLARRLQLARHPSLPEPVRQALSDDFERFVRRAQEQLEANTRAGLRQRSASQEEELQILHVLRENSLLGVLNLDLTQDGARGSVQPLPQPDFRPEDRPGSPRRRRTIIHD
ncbi:MAG: hypothetical protein ACK5LN_13570 [Propioniciclava sp.]